MTSFHAEVLPSGECTRSVCPPHMQQRPPVPDPQYIRICCYLGHSENLVVDDDDDEGLIGGSADTVEGRFQLCPRHQSLVFQGPLSHGDRLIWLCSALITERPEQIFINSAETENQ